MITTRLRTVNCSLFILLCFATIPAQDNKKKNIPVAKPLLTQKLTRQESQRLGYGGTVTIISAPQGSITVVGWQRSEMAVFAEIELQAETEEDLQRLATVNGFTFDQDINHVRLLTTGTHDKNFMRRAAKNFPKKLLGLPWSINYQIRVPVNTDLEIDAGRGPINISEVAGAIRLTAAESEAKLSLTGGTVTATIAVGKVDLTIPVRSWRGSGVEIRLAAGELTVQLPAGFNGDIDAEILRTGNIKNDFGPIESREKPGITPRVIKARAGAGGAYFHFVVGDGLVVLKQLSGT
jgi:hypothetical protein